MEFPSSVDQTPVYNIQAVSRMVGILPVTIRAWERRYGWPRPQRGSQGYRLYSEADVRVLRWLKTQLQAGMSIRQASQLLAQQFATGLDPTLPASSNPPGPVRPDQIRRQLQDRLVQLDQPGALDLLRQAYAFYPLDRILEDLLQPVMVQIGDDWAAGRVSVASEHFASQFVISHLMSQLNSRTAAWLPGVIAAGCVPGEEHEIGLLMLVLLLRLRGHDVRYFGPSLVLDELPETLGPIHPRLILLSATRPEAANNLDHIASIVPRFSNPRPTVIVGGQGFAGIDLDLGAPAGRKGNPPAVIRLTGPLSTVVEAIDRLMQT